VVEYDDDVLADLDHDFARRPHEAKEARTPKRLT
jgi:hypothetical protein